MTIGLWNRIVEGFYSFSLPPPPRKAAKPPKLIPFRVELQTHSMYVFLFSLGLGRAGQGSRRGRQTRVWKQQTQQNVEFCCANVQGGPGRPGRNGRGHGGGLEFTAYSAYGSGFKLKLP